MTRWDERRDGIVRTTVAMHLHIPRPLVAWITTMTGPYGPVNEAEAIDWIVQHVGDLTDEWHTVYATDDDIGVLHADDVNNYTGDDIPVYDGPMPTLRRVRRPTRRNTP